MGGVNSGTTQLVDLRNDGKAVFKSDANYRSEAAAYNVAKVIGMDDLVPPTVLRKGADGLTQGSAQEFLESSKQIALFYGSVPMNDLVRSLAFDMLTGNVDRHAGNMLIDETGKLRLIDHGSLFRENDSQGVAEDSWQSNEIRNAYNGGVNVDVTDVENAVSPKELGKLFSDRLPDIEREIKSAMIYVPDRWMKLEALPTIRILSNANSWRDVVGNG
ncbi:MAG: hypothetical protein KGL39_30600 [Patescibacteria group bacterium]|nr:hypothetical protein [Patescibacteria group bacterium]